jgi:hypothetical protein
VTGGVASSRAAWTLSVGAIKKIVERTFAEKFLDHVRLLDAIPLTH